jgi:tRNA(Arg) A34 adenosine deaminase TadA
MSAKKTYKFNYQRQGERMVVSAISDQDGSVIAQASYTTIASPYSHGEFCAAHKHVNETAHQWAYGKSSYRWEYEPVVEIWRKK